MFVLKVKMDPVQNLFDATAWKAKFQKDSYTKYTLYKYLIQKRLLSLKNPNVEFIGATPPEDIFAETILFKYTFYNIHRNCNISFVIKISYNTSGSPYGLTPALVLPSRKSISVSPGALVLITFESLNIPTHTYKREVPLFYLENNHHPIPNGYSICPLCDNIWRKPKYSIAHQRNEFLRSLHDPALGVASRKTSNKEQFHKACHKEILEDYTYINDAVKKLYVGGLAYSLFSIVKSSKDILDNYTLKILILCSWKYDSFSIFRKIPRDVIKLIFRRL